MSELTLERLDQMRGAPVYDSAGDEIGSVEEIFYDADTNRPEWIGIGTGFFGTKRVLVPTAGADMSAEAVTVKYDKAMVKGSPDIDGDEISQTTERELYGYYGLAYSEQRSDSGLPEGAAGGGGADADVAITRSEEELHVGTEQREAGRARLRKWVETEPVEMDVELTRETARVVREPINEPTTAAAIGEDEVEVTLREERPVVEKQTVAKERIGLEKDVESRRETVRDEVRKERVDIDES
jgi:sporulation protein YlmC with PRC-barrel domain